MGVGPGNVTHGSRQLRFHWAGGTGQLTNEWRVVGGTDGAVAIVWYLLGTTEQPVPSVAGYVVTRAWRAAARLVECLGGFGGMQVAIAAHVRGGVSWPGSIVTERLPTRASSIGPPSDAAIARVEREFRWASGETAGATRQGCSGREKVYEP